MSDSENRPDVPELIWLWQDPASKRKKQVTVTGMLNLSRSSVQKLCKLGKIKTVRVGVRRVFATRASVLALMNGSGA